MIHTFIRQIATFNTAAKLTHAKYGTSRPLVQENDLTALLGQLKAACVAGGTVKDDLLEIQGDHLDRVHDLLVAVGWLRAPTPSRPQVA